jgi:signal transduction histidine kinase
MVGKNAFELIHPEDMRGIVLPALPILIKGDRIEPVEFRFKIKNGTYVWLEGRVSSASETNGNLKIIVVSRDIRARKKAEEAAKESHKKLEIVNQKLHVVGSLTRHDIANKLSAAKANTYLLKKKLIDHPELIKYIDAIDETVNQSSKIFEFSRIYEKIGAEEPTLVNVAEQFKLAADLLPHDSVEIINNTGDLIVLADNMLQQLFYNLVDNSLKHGRIVTVIELNYEQDATQTRLIYQDNGSGIPNEDKDKIFSEGFTTGGSGVGLKLVKRMIEVYGWTINEEGEPGKGAKFVITIPRNN